MSRQQRIQRRIISLIFELAYLGGRRQAGMRLSADNLNRLDALEQMLGGDPGWSRRRHRRISVLAPSTVCCNTELSPATVLNMSAGGALLVTPLQVAPGDRMLIKLDQPGAIQYSFACTVCRVSERAGGYLVAVKIQGIPLEVHYGRPPAAPPSRPDNPVRTPLARTG